MNRVEEIIDIIFSLSADERKDVERGIKKRKEEMKGARYYRTIFELKAELEKRKKRGKV